MRYGLVDAAFTDTHKYEDWLYVGRADVYICYDDALIMFQVSKVYTRFGEWAVTEYGVEHLTSRTKVAYDGLYARGIEGYCLRKLGYSEKDYTTALGYARHIYRNAYGT